MCVCVCVCVCAPVSKRNTRSRQPWAHNQNRAARHHVPPTLPYDLWYSSVCMYTEWMCICVCTCTCAIAMSTQSNPRYRVASPEDALSSRLFFAKEPLTLGLFCGKWPFKIRHSTIRCHLEHATARHTCCHMINDIDVCVRVLNEYVYVYVHVHVRLPWVHTRIHAARHRALHMLPYDQGYACVRVGWLRCVGSIKLQVSFAKEPYKIDNILQKRLIISSILRTIATP